MAKTKVTFAADKTERRKISQLTPHPKNPRVHSEAQIVAVAAMIREVGFTKPLLIDEHDTILAGHGATLSAERVGLDELPVVVLRGLTEAQKLALVFADNRSFELGGWNESLRLSGLSELKQLDYPLELAGFQASDLVMFVASANTEHTVREQAAGNLAERFGLAPFSVLNAREGWWQDRKRAWLALGIKSELGRGENLLKMSDTILQPDPLKRADLMRGEHVVRKKTGAATFGEIEMDGAPSNGTSIFDPVLTELCYRWFCPPGGAILDPFAGGSVRGVVASHLGRPYTGIDLRPEQIAANKSQLDICKDPKPRWLEGDSRHIATVVPKGDQFDFVFSCPPYWNLERYSDDRRDLSTLDSEDFFEAQAAIIRAACARLRNNRFAGWVVGDVRDEKGLYVNIPGRSIEAFEQCGMRLYNEAILVTAAGSLALRAGKQFEASRKLGKSHQNVLIFVKGDPVKATKDIGLVEFAAIEEEAAPRPPRAPPPAAVPGSRNLEDYGTML